MPIYTTPSHLERGAPTAPASRHIWHSQRSYRAAHSDHLRRTSYCLPATVSALTPRVYLAAVRFHLLCNGDSAEPLSSPPAHRTPQGLREGTAHHTVQAGGVAASPSPISNQAAVPAPDLGPVLLRAPGQKDVLGSICGGLPRLAKGERVHFPVAPDRVRRKEPSTERRGRGRRLVTIQLRQTKTSQLGSRGTAIFRESNDASLCLVRATKQYAETTRWPNQQHPFFLLRDSKLLTPRDNNTMLHRAFGPSVASHSLCSGGTTRMADSGTTGYVLQAAGRWASGAYISYVHRPAGTTGNLGVSRSMV